MDIINIDTSQYIDIELPIASIGERIVATIIDILFIGCIIAFIAFVAGGSTNRWMMFLVSIPIALYSIISELAMNGQSWGKKIMKIKVVKLDGTPTTFSSYFLRWITRIIEIYGMFGSLALITIILNRKGQRLGDIAANTTVIRLLDKSLNKTFYAQVPDNYTVVYPEVSLLSVNDIYTIQEVLELLRSKHITEQLLSLARKAHGAIEQKMDVKANQKTEEFFQTIIADFNFINSKF